MTETRRLITSYHGTQASSAVFMNPLWQQYLLHHGLGDDRARRLGSSPPAAETPAMAADLSHLGVIQAQGTDAAAFLQGQLSTDLRALTSEAGQLSSWSSPKGRVLSLFHLFIRTETIHLTLPTSLLEFAIKRLGVYVLRSKVTLTDTSNELARFGVVGDQATAQLQNIGLTVPTHRWETVTVDSITVMRLHGETPRFACHGPAPRIIELAMALDHSVRWVNDDTWALHAIMAGEPTIYPQTSDRFVAQMLDLEQFEGISFKKGCYTGQEIIARAQYRGTIKRHLRRARCESSERILPGTTIAIEDQDHIVGEVLDARPDMVGKTQMLAIIHDEHRGARLALPNGIVVALEV